MMSDAHEHQFIDDGDYLHAAGECDICGLHYRDYIKQLQSERAALVEIAEAVASPWKLDHDALKTLSAKARALLAQQQNGETGE